VETNYFFVLLKQCQKIYAGDHGQAGTLVSLLKTERSSYFKYVKKRQNAEEMVI